LSVRRQLLGRRRVERERVLQHSFVGGREFAAGGQHVRVAPVRLGGERDVARRRFLEAAAALTLDEAGDQLRDALDREVHDRAFAQRVVAVVDRVGLEELARLVGHHRRQRVDRRVRQRQRLQRLALRLQPGAQALQELVAHRLARPRVDAVERRGDFLRQVAHEVDVAVLGAVDDREVRRQQPALEVAVAHRRLSRAPGCGGSSRATS
jgi:hypothetical protein